MVKNPSYRFKSMAIVPWGGIIFFYSSQYLRPNFQSADLEEDRENHKKMQWLLTQFLEERFPLPNMARLVGQESRDSQCLANCMDVALELLGALQRKDIKTFERLLDDAEPAEINKRHDYPHYCTCLELASKNGQADFLALLIKHEAEINSYNAVRKTRALHMAVQNGQHECVQLLLSSGADVNARDGHGRHTPLHVLMSTWDESTESPTIRFPTLPLPATKEAKFARCFQLLLDHTDLDLAAENDDGCSALELAIRRQNTFATRILLDHGAPITENVRESVEEMEELMPDLEKRIKEATEQQEKGFREINLGDQLWKAIRANDHKSLRTFLERLPSPSSVQLDDTSQSLTYVQHCCKEGFPECLHQLLLAGANSNLASFSDPRPPIILAAYNGHAHILKLLSEHSSTDTTACDSMESQQNALHKIVMRLNQNSSLYLDCLNALLNYEKNLVVIDKSDSSGNTPLHYAVQTGIEDAVLILLRKGASLGLKNVLGETPVTNMLPQTLETFLDECIVQNKKEGRAARDYHITFNYNFLATRTPLPRSDSVGALNIAPNATYSDIKENVTFITDSEKQPKPVFAVPMPTDNFYPESEALWYLSRSSRHQYLLRHPVVTSFLLLKWHKIRSYFYINLSIYLFTILLLTAYVLVREQSIGTDYPNASQVALSVLWYILVFMVSLLFIREFFQFGIAPIRYLCSLENYFELGMLTTTAIVLKYSKEPESVQHISSLAVLLAWAEFLLMIGRHPRLSIFVATFISVTVSFFKLLLWYSILIFGFALSFHLIFKNPASAQMEDTASNLTTLEPGGEVKNENFQTLPLTMLKIVAMMTGELEFSDLPFDLSPITSRAIFLTFVFLITVVLLNLLNGLAVSDTQAIRSQAETISYASLVDLVSYIESMLLGDPFHFLSNYPPFRWLRRVPDANCCRSFLRMPSLRPCMQRYSTLLFNKCLPNKAYTVYPNRRTSQRPNQDVIGIPACHCHQNFSLPYENIEAACIRLQEMTSAKEASLVSLQSLEDKLEDLRDTVRFLSEKQEQFMHLLQSTLTPSRPIA